MPQDRSVKAFQVVIPAKAGIQAALLQEDALMDSRFRGNDEIMGLYA